MIKKLSNKYLDLVALVAGIVLPLAFAPYHFYLLAFVSPLLLLLTWTNTTPKRAAWRGFLYGVGEFGSGVSWVYISIHIFGQAPIFLSGIILILFVMYLAIFPTLQGYLMVRLFPSANFSKFALVYPATWVFFELLRSWLFSGFPWLLLGYSQVGTPLQGFAPLLGVYGISYIVVFCSALLGIIVFNLKHKTHLTVCISLIVLMNVIGLLLNRITWTTPRGNPVTTALVQGNIQQELKWRPEQILKTLNLYVHYSKNNFDKDLIVWPEAAITLPQTEMTDFLQKLNELVQKNHSTIITGIPIISAQKIYNGIITIGNGKGTYLKRHLVPFGEYIPLKSFFDILMSSLKMPMSDVDRGPRRQKPLQLRDVFIAPYICYEIAYPLEVLAFLPKAELLLTITDDSWFGRSTASAQHLQMAQMRSIETGRYLLFSGNTGITAIINPKGKILSSLQPFEEKVLVGSIQPMSGNTPWIFWKMIPMYIILFISLVLGFRKKRLYQK